MEGSQSLGPPAVFSGLLYKLAPRLGGRLWLSEILANIFNSSFGAPRRLLYSFTFWRCITL